RRHTRFSRDWSSDVCSSDLQIPIAAAKDSSMGIYLNWEPLAEQALFSGIVIERSRSPKDGFTVIDTLGASATEYLDRWILPNIIDRKSVVEGKSVHVGGHKA